MQLQWQGCSGKKSSLTILTTNSEQAFFPDHIKHGRSNYKIEQVEEMEMLGALVDFKGSTKTSIIHRIHITEIKIWAEREMYTSKRRVTQGQAP